MYADNPPWAHAHPDPNQRAADADREKTSERLRRHHAEGRLDAEEFQERVDRCYQAKTLGELDQLVTDLPPEPTREGRFAPPTPADGPARADRDRHPGDRRRDRWPPPRSFRCLALDPTLLPVPVLRMAPRTVGHAAASRHHRSSSVRAERESPANAGARLQRAERLAWIVRCCWCWARVAGRPRS